MKIRTKRSPDSRNSKGGQLPLMKAPVRKTNQQKIGKNRMTVRRVLTTARTLGKLAGILFIAGSAVFIGRMVYNSDMFRLRNIAVYDCKEIDRAKLEEIVRDNSPDNVLAIELQTLKKRLQQEKWVKNVKIRRVLPSGLVIHVQERVPSVILEMSGQLLLADDDGVLLDRYDPHYGKLDVPVFKGVLGRDAESYDQYREENSRRIRSALNMLHEIGSGTPQYTQKISEIDISDPSNLKIILVDDSVEIQLGKEDYLNRLHKFFANKDSYEETKKKYGDIVSVDLRFDNIIKFDRTKNVSGSP